LFETELPNAPNVNNSKKVSIVKFKLNTRINYCRSCNSIHSFKKTQKCDPLIDNHPFKNVIPQNPAKHLNKEKLRERLQVLLRQVEQFSQVYKMSLNCDNIRIKIVNTINNRFKVDLASCKDSLLKELDQYEQECLNNFAQESDFVQNLKQFIKKHEISNQTIEHYLNNEESKQVMNDDLMHFNAELDEKRREFFSYLLMNRRVLFEASKQSENLADDQSLSKEFLIGFLNFIEYF
jgi:hypothetical protein